jgi:hypothetical protein
MWKLIISLICPVLPNPQSLTPDIESCHSNFWLWGVWLALGMEGYPKFNLSCPPWPLMSNLWCQNITLELPTLRCLTGVLFGGWSKEVRWKGYGTVQYRTIQYGPRNPISRNFFGTWKSCLARPGTAFFWTRQFHGTNAKRARGGTPDNLRAHNFCFVSARFHRGACSAF